MENNTIRDLYQDLFGKKTPPADPTDSSGHSVSPENPDSSSGRHTPPESSLPGEDIMESARLALEDAKRILNDFPNIHSIEDLRPKETGEKTGGDTAAASAPEAQPQTAPEPQTDPMEDLESLIGLDGIKQDVKELMDFVKIQKLRRDEGLKSVPASLHLVFTGNPGTGKTTVARIIARLYRSIGVLSKGQLVEVDRSGLVAGYVGQTAIKTQEKIQEALGGVLFIDEAYALAGGEQDNFGQEAINTLLKAMEDHRDDFVVIVAGYTKPMEHFIGSNPGLKSRFNKYIEFPDYSIDELEQIFQMNCKKYDYIMDEETRHRIRGIITTRKDASPENFANAREVRNLFEEIITNQARRVAQMENPGHEEMMRITMEDV